MQTSDGQQVTLSAVVSLMRIVYVDGSDKLTSVQGNTSANIQPQVMRSYGNQTVPMNAKIAAQYDQLLAQNNYHLEPGKSYQLKTAHPKFLSNLLKVSLLKLGFY